AIRTITATSGDIWVMGTVHTADLGGGTRQGIKLVAQGGDVFIVGNLDASGVSSGVNGGTIEISARHVVVMGRIDASGGDAIGAGDRTGGAGANVTLRAYGGVTVAGSVVV